MRRVLIVTYYWPPVGGSGVQRWAKFSKYLRDYGWEPVIYTPSNPETGVLDKNLEKDLPEGLEVVRTKIFEPYGIYRKLTGGASTQITNLVGPAGSRPSFKKRLSVFIRGNFFIPDPRRGWVKPSVKYLLRYLEDNPVDAVITTGPPHSVHLIGRGIRRKTGLPWVADFRDPWTKMFYFKDLHLLPYARKAHLRLEESVLSEASALVAVSPQVRDDFAARTGTRLELITNGYDESDFAGPAPVTQDGVFRIVHTGLFGSDGNPETLWEVLSQMCGENPDFEERMEVQLIGKVDTAVRDSIGRSGISTKVSFAGYLSHADSVTAQRTAGLLLLPLREGEEGGKIIPGKLFEYLAARRPVLGIGSPQGSSAAVLKECGAGKMVAWDDEQGMRECVEKAWEDFLLVKGNLPENDSILKYSRRALCADYAKLLDSLI